MATCPYLCIYSEQLLGYNVIKWSHEVLYPLCKIFNLLCFLCENLSEYEQFQPWQGFIFIEIFVIEF